jgi:Sporulation and spore germination
MARHWKIAIAILGAFVVLGALTLPALLNSVLRLRHSTVSEEQARREITQPPISTPSDVLEKVQLFWISPTAPTTLEPSEVELPLSANLVQRAKQLIDALITKAPSPAQRTLPADTELIEFYLLGDGTAVADFSEALSSQTPSGILSEQLAVDSIVRTLGANMAAVRRLKILIRGQQVDTLAGHLDLTGFFPVTPAGMPATTSAETATPTPAASPNQIPAAVAAPAKPAANGSAAAPSPAR